MPVHLGDLEQLVLLALLRLGEEAYGVTVREELSRVARRHASYATIYSTLDRLETKGLVKAWLGDPTPERGGRRKRFFALTAAGDKALRQSLGAMERMARGVAPIFQDR
jgi:DNA-binding PadR family transcriptional regulator